MITAVNFSCSFYALTLSYLVLYAILYFSKQSTLKTFSVETEYIVE